MASKDFVTSSNYRPGEPLRSWEITDGFAVIDLGLLLQSTRSRDAFSRVIDGAELSDRDLIALARLNSQCVAQWRMPPTMIHIAGVFLDPHAAAVYDQLVADEDSRRDSE